MQGPADRLGYSPARMAERRDTSRPAGGLCQVAGVSLKATQESYPNPLIANFKKRNKQEEKYFYLWGCLSGMVFGVLLDDVFDKGVDRTRLMTKKCIWFRLCGVKKVLTLPEFTVLLGLYKEVELHHGLFAIHFTKLEVDDKLFNHEEFWQKIGKPTSTNLRTSLIKEPLMRIVHKLLVGSLVHRAADQPNFAYPTYEPPNVPPYPYPYMPYPHPYTHYPDTGSPTFGGDHYRAHVDGYHVGFIIPSLSYEIKGSSAGFHREDFDPIVHSKDCVESDDDEMRD
uniref:Uncharacterized protein n=1 Tax=Tanacetum cinerariifolium TaxID=118510 RepID=A0A6L2MM51_TANCI|nr:hypothetical protein [Tanacetum cinerariifolium]